MNIPRVSIILPVYNGENYLQAALDSVLAQTFTDFELIVMDNASTDATAAICHECAERDSRMRYFRNEKNLGASMNHILGFRHARAEYVKYMAHDDAWEPTMLQKSVRALDAHPEAVLVHARTRLMNERGEFFQFFDPGVHFSSPRARDRIRSAVWGRHGAYPIFGLARASAMKKTRNLLPFVDSDRVWLARLALQGPFHEIPEYLFYSRIHGERYGAQASRPAAQLAWFDPTKVRKLVMPAVRLYFEYLRAVLEARLPLGEKMACFWVAATCFRQQWWRGKLRDDLGRAYAYFFRSPTHL